LILQIGDSTDPLNLYLVVYQNDQGTSQVLSTPAIRKKIHVHEPTGEKPEHGSRVWISKSFFQGFPAMVIAFRFLSPP
jgi:hypothetical protein